MNECAENKNSLHVKTKVSLLNLRDNTGSVYAGICLLSDEVLVINFLYSLVLLLFRVLFRRRHAGHGVRNVFLYIKIYDMKKIVLFVSLIIVSVNLIYAQKLKVKLGGRLLLDGVVYADAPDTLDNKAGIVDLRLAGKAMLGDDWLCKIDVGFSGNKVAVKDAFLQYLKKGHCVRAGYMLGFFGIEQSKSSNDLVFNTGAGVEEVFQPGRRVGLSYISIRNKSYLSFGMFLGDGLTTDEHTESGYNGVMRCVWRPVDSGNRMLHVGISGLYKVPDMDKNTGLRKVTLGGTGVSRLKSAKFQYLSLDHVRNQMEAGVECYSVENNWMFQGEYTALFINRHGMKQYKAQGGYFQVGWLAKGKNFAYDRTDALPLMPCDDNSLLLAVRYNILNLNASEIGLYGGMQQDVTVGLNYYLNGYISTRLNYSYVMLDQYALLGKARFHAIQARLQFRF